MHAPADRHMCRSERWGKCAPPGRGACAAANNTNQWTGFVVCGYVTSVAAYSIRVPAYLHG